MIAIHHPAPAGVQPVVHVCADADRVAAAAGELIAAAITRTVRSRGRCRLALSGGSTPAPIFAWLADHLPRALYAQLSVTWCDERVLPCAPAQPGDWQAFGADSNLRLAFETWLSKVPFDPRRALPLALSGDAGAELVRFGRAFLADFGGAVDVVLLGVGADGHVASLFPGHPALDVEDLCLAVHDSPKPPAERISLALPVIDRARVVIVSATGAAKADVLARTWSGEADDLPIARVRGGGDLHWVLDRGAASGILTKAIQSEES